MHVFIDTEFTDFERPDLISVALVTDEGHEFYAERTDFHEPDCSEFVRDHVLPLPGRVPGAPCRRDELMERLRDWISDLPEPLTIVCDYDGDWKLLDKALCGDDEGCTLSDFTGKFLLGHTILEDAAFLQAQAAAYMPEWPRHHALADARALRAGCVAWQKAMDQVWGAPPILFLDFDGVLHLKSVYLGRNGQPVLMWAPLLIEALAPYPDLRIVLSTKWVHHLGFDATLAHLPQALRDRVVGSTWHAVETYSAFSRGLRFGFWRDATRYQEIRHWVKHERVAHWIAIDDDAEDWGKDDLDSLIRTDGAKGLSDPLAIAQLKAALAGLRDATVAYMRN